MEECEHNYLYGGVKYEDTDIPRPGSGARIRYYYDFYYCTKCVSTLHRKVDYSGTTYDNILFNATPKES